MVPPPSLQKPQTEFVENFLQPHQLRRMLIYFSKQQPTDTHAQYGFTDIIVRLANDPLCIIFGQHGVYLFSNYLLVYPYNELDSQQVAYISNFLRTHITLPPSTDTSLDTTSAPPAVVPSMTIDVRVTKQMGGGYTVRPIQLANIRLKTFDILAALVRGIMCGSQKHDLKYRRHAVNLQLQRILTRIVVSRAQLQEVNAEIEMCIEKQKTALGLSTSTEPIGSVSDPMVECV